MLTVLTLSITRPEVCAIPPSDARCCLQGKDKPTYSPERDEGDIVVVKNARHVEFTGKKWDQKLYRWHTG